ncbi:hypothetical protein MMPV_008804 [Pyropia vietnamensis]
MRRGARGKGLVYPSAYPPAVGSPSQLARAGWQLVAVVVVVVVVVVAAEASRRYHRGATHLTATASTVAVVVVPADLVVVVVPADLVVVVPADLVVVVAGEAAVAAAATAPAAAPADAATRLATGPVAVVEVVVAGAAAAAAPAIFLRKGGAACPSPSHWAGGGLGGGGGSSGADGSPVPDGWSPPGGGGRRRHRQASPGGGRASPLRVGGWAPPDTSPGAVGGLGGGLALSMAACGFSGDASSGGGGGGGSGSGNGGGGGGDSGGDRGGGWGGCVGSRRWRFVAAVLGCAALMAGGGAVGTPSVLLADGWGPGARIRWSAAGVPRPTSSLIGKGGVGRPAPAAGEAAAAAAAAAVVPALAAAAPSVPTVATRDVVADRLAAPIARDAGAIVHGTSHVDTFPALPALTADVVAAAADNSAAADVVVAKAASTPLTYPPDDAIRSGVSIIAACRGRHAALAAALPTWLAADGIDEVVLVDWGSTPPLAASLSATAATVGGGIDVTTVAAAGAAAGGGVTPPSGGTADVNDTTGWDPRLRVVRVANADAWVLSRAYNLAARLSTYSATLRLDCDHTLHPSFIDTHPLSSLAGASGSWYAGNWAAAADENGVHVNGALFVERSRLLRVGGYDERVTGYGWEDAELGHRLADGGGGGRRDLRGGVAHLPHGDDQRVAADGDEGGRGHPAYIAAHIQLNALLLDKLPGWGTPAAASTGAGTPCAYVAMPPPRAGNPDGDNGMGTVAAVKRVALVEGSCPPPLTALVREEEVEEAWATATARALHDSWGVPWAVVAAAPVGVREALLRAFADAQRRHDAVAAAGDGKASTAAGDGTQVPAAPATASVSTAMGAAVAAAGGARSLRATVGVRADVVPSPPPRRAKFLLIHVQHGLGNRLRALASAAAYASATGRVLLVAWGVDAHMRAAYTDLFAPVSGVHVLDPSYDPTWPPAAAAVAVTATDRGSGGRAEDPAWAGVTPASYMHGDTGPGAAPGAPLFDDPSSHLYLRSAYVVEAPAHVWWDAENAALRRLVPLPPISAAVTAIAASVPDGGGLGGVIGVHVRQRAPDGELREVDAPEVYGKEGVAALRRWRAAAAVSVFRAEMEARDAAVAAAAATAVPTFPPTHTSRIRSRRRVLLGKRSPLSSLSPSAAALPHWFVAADDPVVVATLAAAYPGRVSFATTIIDALPSATPTPIAITTPSTTTGTTTTPFGITPTPTTTSPFFSLCDPATDARSIGCVRRALVDLYALAETRELWGSGWSSFTEAALRLGAGGGGRARLAAAPVTSR